MFDQVVSLKAKLSSARKENTEIRLALEAAVLQYLLYSKHECPNQPLIDDVERFRSEAQKAIDNAEMLRDALKFYADGGGWRARAALAVTESV